MEQLEIAIGLRKEEKYQEAKEKLAELVSKYPGNAMANYQYAWILDLLELEKQAIPFYKKAIELGLPDLDLADAYIGLGSTYRTIGDYKKSKDILELAQMKFPKDNAIKVFYAMTLFNLNQHEESMNILLKSIADNSEDQRIKSYQKSIRFYSDNLNKTW